MNKVESNIAELLHDYPTLFGRSHLRVFSQLFVTNGNGYEWHKGALKSISTTKVKETPDWNSTLTWARKVLKSDEPDFKLNIPLEVRGMLQMLYQPVCFSSLSLRNYSILGHLPSDIKDDWLSAVAKTLLYILHYRTSPREAYYTDPEDHYTTLTEPNSHYHQDSNHANALVLLMRYEKMFGNRAAWRTIIDHPETIAPYYKGAPFWDILELRGEQRLKLSCKCSLRTKNKDGFNEDPKNLLSVDEYLDYFEIDPTGFEDETSLLRDLHHHYWMIRHDKLKQQLAEQKQTRKAHDDIGEGAVDGTNLVIPATPELLKLYNHSSLLKDIVKRLKSKS
jgi:hypothetical protein